MTSARQLIGTGCRGSRAAAPRRRVVTIVPVTERTGARYKNRTNESAAFQSRLLHFYQSASTGGSVHE